MENTKHEAQYQRLQVNTGTKYEDNVVANEIFLKEVVTSEV